MELLLEALGPGLGLALVALDLAIVVVLVPYIVLQRRESGATLAWIFFILLVPYLGLLAFWVFGTTRLHLRRRKRRRSEARLAARLDGLTPERCPEPAEGGPLGALRRLAVRLDEVGPQPGNQVQLFREGRAAFQALSQSVEEARHHIHLLYYIWQPDATGARLRDTLVAAARRGVEVRLLVDDVGSRRAGARFFAPLTAAGGAVRRFLPVNVLARQLVLNNRNHRKVVVIDGRMGYTGGMNVGDEYAQPTAAWRDAQVQVVGPAVLRLQEIFCQDWYHATGEELAQPSYFPPVPPGGEAWVQFLASGPADLRWRSIHTLLFAAVNLAQQRVWIETPYFVPDPAIAMALQTAALRGVDVRLLLPGSSDHPLVLHAGRSFYGDLIAAGARIYELPIAMLHAKTATIDGIFSTVGSTNMDQRSFRLNFEANAFFYGREMAEALERSFVSTQAESEPVTVRHLKRRSYRTRLLEAAARTLGPVL